LIEDDSWVSSAASEMLIEVALPLDQAGEETMAHDAVDLAELVNSCIPT
jgi:hypothetical protein